MQKKNDSLSSKILYSVVGEGKIESSWEARIM
jgi:hypothetical protein